MGVEVDARRVLIEARRQHVLRLLDGHGVDMVDALYFHAGPLSDAPSNANTNPVGWVFADGSRLSVLVSTEAGDTARANAQTFVDQYAALTGGAVTDGSSLFCNSTAGAPYNGIRAGADVNTWQFADGVHPTTGGHKALSDVAVKLLQSYGWF